MSAKYLLLPMVAATALTLAACGQSQAPTSGVSAPAAQSQTAAAGSATLTVTPDAVADCHPPRPVVATVNWHSAVPKVKVMVTSPSQATPHLFSESGFTGSAQTGDWVVAKTRFELVDAADGKQLAQVIVGTKTCN